MQQESPLSGNGDTPRDSPINESTTNINKKGRGYRKSRGGCKTCKIRRIKCDEEKPHCANCRRRQARCEYAIWTTLEADAAKAKKTTPGDLDTSQIELTYHWTTATCYTLSAWPSGAAHWQALLGSVGLRHQHVLHHMFALTALHLASYRPDQQEGYLSKAEHHYERALAMVTPEIANISLENCDAVLLSVQLICFVGLARGPQPGEYLAFGEHGRSEWLFMFRGIRTTLDSFGVDKFAKAQGAALPSKSRPLPIASAPLGYEEQLHELSEHVAFITAGQPGCEDNIQAVAVLRERYVNRYSGNDSEYHVVFAWLYMMSEVFLDQLQQHEPIPLIIYAHFIVLMHEMERFWYMKGWTRHVMYGIFNSLQAEHRSWIRWPIARIGWIAPQ